jgi:hypothetical protein
MEEVESIKLSKRNVIVRGVEGTSIGEKGRTQGIRYRNRDQKTEDKSERGGLNEWIWRNESPKTVNERLLC